MPHLEIWEWQEGNPQLALGLAQRLSRTEKRYVCILVKPWLQQWVMIFTPQKTIHISVQSISVVVLEATKCRKTTG